MKIDSLDWCLDKELEWEKRENSEMGLWQRKTWRLPHFATWHKKFISLLESATMQCYLSNPTLNQTYKLPKLQGVVKWKRENRGSTKSIYLTEIIRFLIAIK